MKEAQFKTDFTEIELEPLDYDSVQKILKSKMKTKNGTGLFNNMTGDAVKTSYGKVTEAKSAVHIGVDTNVRRQKHKRRTSSDKTQRYKIRTTGHRNSRLNKFTDQQKRFERLGRMELRILQYASVIGNEFTDILLKKTSNLLSNETNIEGGLEKLTDNRFIRRSDKTFGSERYFEFHHDVIREVIYETIPEDNKKIIHKTAGEAIENIFHSRIEQYYYVLCEHFEKGGAEEKLIDYLEKAGDRARESFENERAIGYYEKICIITSEKNPVTFSRLIFKKLQLYKLLGKWSEALKICRDLSNRNDFKRNAELNFQLNFLTADIYYNQSNYSNSIKLLSKMSKTYTDNSDKYLEITGLLCLNYYESGNPNKAENYAKTFFNISSESNNKLNSAKAYEYFGLIERSKRNYKASVSYFQKSIDLFIQSKDLIKSAVLNNRVGINYLQLSEYKKSLEYFERCKVQTEKNGDIREYLNVIGNISVAYNAMGKNEQAFKICKKKIEFSRRIDYKEGIAGTLASIGNYYYDEKLYDNALNKYSEALKLFEEIEKNSYCKYEL